MANYGLQTPVEGQTCRSMASLGNYNYAADGKSGVAALAGNLRGGVHFRQIGEFRDLGDGRLEGEFEHMFVTEDGSTLRTRDKSWGVAVPGTDYIVGGAAYTVVDGTGEFKDFEGTFQSWGTFAPKEGKAILRYEGQICRRAKSYSVSCMWCVAPHAFSRERGEHSDESLSSRLAAGMFPLTTQLRFLAFQALEPVYRLRGEDVPEDASSPAGGS